MKLLRNIIYTALCIGASYLIYLCLVELTKPEPTKEKGWGYLHEEAN